MNVNIGVTEKGHKGGFIKSYWGGDFRFRDCAKSLDPRNFPYKISDPPKYFVTKMCKKAQNCNIKSFLSTLSTLYFFISGGSDILYENFWGSRFCAVAKPKISTPVRVNEAFLILGAIWILMQPLLFWICFPWLPAIPKRLIKSDTNLH